MAWLTLLTTLPPTPTRHRVGVWRKLQRMGAVRLRGSAWILPETTETTELFQWLVQEIEAFGGEATLHDVVRMALGGGEAPGFLAAHGWADCEIRPLALRVRVPRERPGVPAPIPQIDRTLLLRLALGMPRAGERSDGQRARP